MSDKFRAVEARTIEELAWKLGNIAVCDPIVDAARFVEKVDTAGVLPSAHPSVTVDQLLSTIHNGAIYHIMKHVAIVACAAVDESDVSDDTFRGAVVAAYDGFLQEVLMDCYACLDKIIEQEKRERYHEHEDDEIEEEVADFLANVMADTKKGKEDG